MLNTCAVSRICAVRLSATMRQIYLQIKPDSMGLVHNIIYHMQSAIQEVKATPAFKLQHPELAMPQFITHVQPDHFPAEGYEPLKFKVTQLQLAEFLAHSQPVTAGLSHLFRLYLHACGGYPRTHLVRTLPFSCCLHAATTITHQQHIPRNQQRTSLFSRGSLPLKQ